MYSKQDMKMKFITYEELINDPRWIKSITKRNLPREIAQILVGARITQGYTQGQLAKKIGTTQSGVARAENGTSLPSLSLLARIARAYKTHIRISFESMPEERSIAVKYGPPPVLFVSPTLEPKKRKASGPRQHGNGSAFIPIKNAPRVRAKLADSSKEKTSLL